MGRFLGAPDGRNAERQLLSFVLVFCVVDELVPKATVLFCLPKGRCDFGFDGLARGLCLRRPSSMVYKSESSYERLCSG